jgi:hypothetical protein
MYNEFKFVGDFTSFYNSIQTEHLLLNFGLDSKLFYPLEKTKKKQEINATDVNVYQRHHQVFVL